MTPGNPVRYVEIPVTNLNRAVDFYTALFGHTFERVVVDGYPMALFPSLDGGPGAPAALVMGDIYRPTRDGAVIYHHVPDLERALALAARLGATVLYPLKDLGDLGRVAEIEDSEGNRLALHQPATDAATETP
ncbi:MAG: VOC family protein [Brevundimonas sp.]|uniref:VOC family protein n=1 Tax=Brevundimonas sp. TaxID=1871086 RepID=UPI00273622F5|nr:VOC family protein [Brevundimonas sp.]MDP3404281.1 VOC family protein [Brevundimonas sp.]